MAQHQNLEQLAKIFEQIVYISSSIENNAEILIAGELSDDKDVTSVMCSIELLSKQIGLLGELGNEKAGGQGIKGGVENYLLPTECKDRISNPITGNKL